MNKFPGITDASDPARTAARLALPYAMGVYNALDYGVSPENADNTLAFQILVNEVNKNGGGVIFVPSGVYKFDTAGEHIKTTAEKTGATLCCIRAKNFVSIRGESLTNTVFKVVGNSAQGVTMFGYLGDVDTPLIGCTYENFTVDASEASIDTYSSDGKAFFYQYLKDCIFRDLRLIGTPATAMGNDFLDNVVMDSIYVYNAGRIHAANSPGGAGIGIGTGGFDNENFIVRNCICDSCGHFGIFCEDQALFTFGTPVLRYPKGMTIANNIVRNGRNYGIGLRGGKYALVTGNNVYNNTNGGIYLDFGADSSAVVGNLVSGEVNGLCFGSETNYHACNKISVTGNTFIGCEHDVVKEKEPTNSVIESNVTIA
jgi:parallel beta-helix repeat protein